MSKRAYRFTQAFLLLLTFAVLAASFYFQYIKGLQPCPLCLMQRFCVIMLFMFCMMGMTLLYIKRGRIVAVLQMIFSLAGLFFAARQLWLQSLPPDQTPACLPGLDVLIHYFPWQDVLHALVWGAGDCAEVSWRWLGLSMPAWTILYFLTMFLINLLIFWRLGRSLDYLRDS